MQFAIYGVCFLRPRVTESTYRMQLFRNVRTEEGQHGSVGWQTTKSANKKNNNAVWLAEYFFRWKSRKSMESSLGFRKKFKMARSLVMNCFCRAVKLEFLCICVSVRKMHSPLLITKNTCIFCAYMFWCCPWISQEWGRKDEIQNCAQYAVRTGETIWIPCTTAQQTTLEHIVRVWPHFSLIRIFECGFHVNGDGIKLFWLLNHVCSQCNVSIPIFSERWRGQNANSNGNKRNRNEWKNTSTCRFGFRLQHNRNDNSFTSILQWAYAVWNLIYCIFISTEFKDDEEKNLTN